jgi:hypothetical protein
LYFKYSVPLRRVSFTLKITFICCSSLQF